MIASIYQEKMRDYRFLKSELCSVRVSLANSYMYIKLWFENNKYNDSIYLDFKGRPNIINY